MSRLDRQVRRAQWKRENPVLRGKIAKSVAGVTLEVRATPVRALTFEAWEIAAGLRHPLYQARVRWQRIRLGLKITASDMHRAHGQVL
jgi:hypothetical protein